jgi:hypothetical protein
VITQIDSETIRYEDTFWDQTMDGPVNVWKQMFDYAAEYGLKVRVESIHFTRVFSPMIGEEDKLVGFKMIGELYR